MNKVFKNSSGDLWVRASEGVGKCGIVEILHLWDKENKAGCVIAFYDVYGKEDNRHAELQEVLDRLSTTKFDSDEIIMNAIRYGRKLADLILETNEQ